MSSSDQNCQGNPAGIIHDNQYPGYVRESDDWTAYLRGSRNEPTCPSKLQDEWAKSHAKRLSKNMSDTPEACLNPHSNSSLQPNAPSTSHSKHEKSSDPFSRTDKVPGRAKSIEFDTTHVGAWTRVKAVGDFNPEDVEKKDELRKKKRRGC